MYGYPGVRSTVLDTVPYLCVSHEVEKKQIQPLRLAAVAAGLLVAETSKKIPKTNKNSRILLQVVGLGVAFWSGSIYLKAREAMDKVDLGVAPELHQLKLSPWTARLASTVALMRQGIRENNKAKVLQGIEDASFWVGRIICDAIGAAEGGNIEQFKTSAAGVIEAQIELQKAKQWILAKK